MLIYCCILLDFFFYELYYDARIHERKAYTRSFE